jgi:uncharacterized protein YndB with AHSA1/START domain
MKFNYSLAIKSTPETVFAWIGSPEKARQWMTNVSETEMLHTTPNMVGSTFREVVSEGGQGIEIHGQVVRYDPNEGIAFHLESRVNSVDVEYRVDAIPSGTRLTQSADIRWKFPVNIISLFAGERFRQGLLTQAQYEFGRVKTLCEGNGQ